MDKKQFDEALARLDILVSMGLMSTVRKEFCENGTLYYSERTPLGGILYWADNETWIHDEIACFEEEHNAVVYHATLTYTEFGKILDLFYVSQYEEEWEDDRLKLTQGLSCNYALNTTYPELSEFGWESFGVQAGGVVRLS